MAVSLASGAERPSRSRFRAGLKLVRIEEGQHSVQGLRGLRGQRVHRLAQFAGEFFRAFRQVRELETAVAGLQHDFVGGRVELHVIDVGKTPLKTFRRRRQHREIAFVESNLGGSGLRRVRC